jgi:UDP-2,3-diacylglucosamine pyrophosphatase LpxH
MVTHDDIFETLQAEFPRGVPGGEPAGVFLVARLREPALLMSDTAPYVFIPDTHLVPRPDARSFPWVTAGEPQVAALAALAAALVQLRTRDPRLRVWQLGDFIDLWRTGPKGGVPASDADATVADRGPLINALLNAGMDILIGNHDQELLQYRWPNGRATFSTVILNRASGTGDTILAHGHQFDPVETLPRGIKENFARGFTQLLPPATTGMLEATNPHWKPQPVDAPPPPKPSSRLKFLNFDLTAHDPVPVDRDAVNVVTHTVVHDPARAFTDSLGAGNKPSADGPGQTFFSDAAFWAEKVSTDGRDVRLMVIGHTHRARIVRGSRKDGTPFVLMDCGACVGSGFLSDAMDAAIHHLQIGVKVADDLRIYQLGYDRRE